MITVSALYKKLEKLVKEGHGRKPVCIDKSSFSHPCEEDGAVVIGVEEVTRPHWIPTLDDDGGQKINKDGSESGRAVMVLKGGAK